MRHALMDVNGKLSEELIASFFELPADQYLKQRKAFRFRAFAQGVVKSGAVRWNDDPHFFQSAGINRYAGGVEWRFAPLGRAARESGAERGAAR